MATEFIPLFAPSIRFCYEVARSEANRYQRFANRANTRGNKRKFNSCIARRDACSRIARIIRYGAVNPKRRRHNE